MTTTEPALRIPASPLPEQLRTALRQALPPLVAWAVGRGWLAQDSATLIAALLAILWPIAAGQHRTLTRSRALARLADAVPDDVAVAV